MHLPLENVIGLYESMLAVDRFYFGAPESDLRFHPFPRFRLSFVIGLSPLEAYERKSMSTNTRVHSISTNAIHIFG